MDVRMNDIRASHVLPCLMARGITGAFETHSPHGTCPRARLQLPACIMTRAGLALGVAVHTGFSGLRLILLNALQHHLRRK